MTLTPLQAVLVFGLFMTGIFAAMTSPVWGIFIVPAGLLAIYAAWMKEPRA